MGVEDGPFLNRELLRFIYEDLGIDPQDDDAVNHFIDSCIFDSIVMGACERCGAVSDYCEPDARMNHCEECGHYRVISILVLRGIL